MRIQRFKRERTREPIPYRRMERPAVLIEPEKLATLEWAGSRFNGSAWVDACRVCNGFKPGPSNPAGENGHRAGCWMDAALNASEDEAAA